MKKLVISQVEFSEGLHTYTYNGKSLSGITGIISRYICPDKYKDIPKSVLDKAAQKGSQVHKELSMEIIGFPYEKPMEEVLAYRRLIQEQGIKPYQSEYLVSDLQYVASSIDMVDEDLNLYDFKTTSTLDLEYLRWQLSIYAYLFELQNPTLKAGKLYGMHLRGDNAKLEEVERLPDDIVKALLTCYINKEESFDNPLKAVAVPEVRILTADERQTLSTYISNEKKLAEFQAQVKLLADAQAQIVQFFNDLMREENMYELKGDIVTVTRSKDYERVGLDSTRLKKDHPDIYQQYNTKVTQVKGSIKIKINEVLPTK